VVLGSHVVLCAYGFWLPNDPRGSWSDFVGSWELLRFGRATKTTTRTSVAGTPHDQEARLAAKQRLRCPAVHFTGVQARAIGWAFGETIRKTGLRVWACSILPDHMHLVVGRHRWSVQQIANRLKGDTTRRLVREGIHPLAALPTRTGRMPKMWASKQWKVFLDCPEGIRRAIRYVDRNPAKEGKPLQRWPFVASFDD
jgi:REP-associated tyrosine transposase